MTAQSQQTPDPIIRLDGVSFSYGSGSPRALDAVSLDIAPGEFLGVIGPSGAGKSTLAAALSGAIPHHYRGELYGSVLVGGADTCEVSLTDISRTVGSVLQDIDTQMVASVVEDELLFGLENFGVPHTEIERRLAGALETVGIADLRDREIATLSGGQKQKVAIAAILALAPRVLVLDEPTAALDPESSRMVFETLKRVNEASGVTVVVVEQKVALLSRHCSRIAVMGEGRIRIEGTPHEVFGRSEELRRLGVDSPRTVRISNSLAARGLVGPDARPCLDVDEARALIGRVVSASGGAPAPAPAPSASPHAPAPRPRAEGSEPVVELAGVAFSYGPHAAAVTDLDLAVYPGELVGVVGQNGAGKTTLTKLLCGLLRPSAGVVRIAGTNTAEVPTSRIAAHVATLFQNPDRQICKDTVLEEVAFGLELTGVATGEARRRARAVAERFGLPLEESPFSLSRGQRQMVALASVVVMEPEVVLLDEPTSGLDYRECMTVMETVREMAERGCAVIMVCHDMEVVSDFAERIVVMAGGRIIRRGATAEIFADEPLMREASVEAPQVIRLARALAAEVSPAYAGVSEVADIVRITEEAVRRG
ncbi:MAG: ATP-binding cassette domain-containing protein [Coriobacteriaceae bacterium]|nr:ATP-binding cassette domain-containing protein [Coriobacteriaceae bacterium]